MTKNSAINAALNRRSLDFWFMVYLNNSPRGFAFCNLVVVEIFREQILFVKQF